MSHGPGAEDAAPPGASALAARDSEGAAASPSERATSTGRRKVPGLAELADGVYVYVIPGFIQVNAGIIVGDDAAAVIDTGTTEADARALLEATASVTDLPVRYVINTHHHGDHSFGNCGSCPPSSSATSAAGSASSGTRAPRSRETLASHLPMVAEQIRAVPLAPPTLTFEATAICTSAT